ncbi:hypothetical protein ACHAWF_001689, partial [Thalassiosira exigua]
MRRLTDHWKEFDLDKEMERSVDDLCKEVARRARELKKAEHKAGEMRDAWLEGEAKARAEASGDEDWKKELDDMIKRNRARSTNRKLHPVRMWTNATSQREIEQRILARNQRHLEQMDRERCDNPTTDDIERNHGVNDSVRSLLAGTYVTEHEVNIEMATWLEMMKKSDKEKTAGALVGIIPREAFQDLFRVANEKTSSNSSFGMNYTIWKALASDDEVAKVRCVMLSMPFLFGFANPRWR